MFYYNKIDHQCSTDDRVIFYITLKIEIISRNTRNKCVFHFVMSDKHLETIINLYLHEFSDSLARSLHYKTNLDTYALYDETERVYQWGRNYFHFCVKVGDYYLNANGLNTENELRTFWAKLLTTVNTRVNPENIIIVKKLLPSPYTGDYLIDDELDKMGAGLDIPEHVKNYADMLIETCIR